MTPPDVDKKPAIVCSGLFYVVNPVFHLTSGLFGGKTQVRTDRQYSAVCALESYHIKGLFKQVVQGRHNHQYKQHRNSTNGEKVSG